MPVPDMIRCVTRNVREALSSRENFKEKAKDLPLYMLQTALSGVGQALLIGDRMRNTLRRLVGHAEPAEETDEAGEAREAPAGEKPARREPVIFAPRPESSAPKVVEGSKAEANGTKARVEPVIFAPATPKAPAKEAAEPRMKPETEAQVKPETVEPAEPAATEVAEVVETVELVEIVEATAVAEPSVAESAEPRAAAPAPGAPAEPIPGYGELTVASLRARMRGKSAEQMRELLAYERATTARPEVVRMYEKRLAKLEAAE